MIKNLISKINTKELKFLTLLIAGFLALFFLPVGSPRFDNAVMEALYLAKDYAREHVLFCLIPAFFIAGAIAVFISQASVIKYLGPNAKKITAYGVSSVSGCILAVCSCTVLPLFSGIYKMGAGLGPAVTFLYSGPAINVLAIVLTARVLGAELGIARAVGAIVISIIIGLAMHLIFIKEQKDKASRSMFLGDDDSARPLWKTAMYFASLVAILVFANWGKTDATSGAWFLLYSYKWHITAIAGVVLGIVLILWFSVKWWKIFTISTIVAITVYFFGKHPEIPFVVAIVGLSIITATGNDEDKDWLSQTWGFTKQITPLLLFGVLAAGFFLGRPGGEGIIPSQWVSGLVGGNSLGANLFASVVGAFMYFATLTEVPILEGLIGNGMGKGPALALLLAGPALSLPNMLVIRSVLGTKKTVVFVMLVIVMSTLAGLIYGII